MYVCTYVCKYACIDICNIHMHVIYIICICICSIYKFARDLGHVEQSVYVIYMRASVIHVCHMRRRIHVCHTLATWDMSSKAWPPDRTVPSHGTRSPTLTSITSPTWRCLYTHTHTHTHTLIYIYIYNIIYTYIYTYVYIYRPRHPPGEISVRFASSRSRLGLP